MYANSGNEWDAVNKKFIPKSLDQTYEKLAVDWFKNGGAKGIGGCCEIGDTQIRLLREEVSSNL